MSNFYTNVSPLAERSSEKFLMSLFGKTNVKDALKRLDDLTNEEVRMANVQVLKATHVVGDRVREVVGQVQSVDDRVISVDDRVAVVDNRVKDVDARVATVDERVKAVDDKVAVVIDGAHPSPAGCQVSKYLTVMPRWECNKGSHTASSQ